MFAYFPIWHLDANHSNKKNHCFLPTRFSSVLLFHHPLIYLPQHQRHSSKFISNLAIVTDTHKRITFFIVMSHAPRTPPRRVHATQLWTPGSPRYAPIDEPDMPSKYQDQHQQRDSTKGDIVRPLPVSHDNMKHIHHGVSAVTLPLTPEQTPINRKKKNLDLISRTTIPQGHSGRILFPTSSPAKGTGRLYKRITDTERTEHKLPVKPSDVNSATKIFSKTTLDTKNSIRHASPAKKGLDDCPSTSFTPERAKAIFSKPRKTIKTSPEPPPKVEIFDDRKTFKAEIQHDPFAGPPRGLRRKASSDLKPEAKKRAIETTAKHPYDTSIDPSVPGMWYNFRGKKVFRPFPNGRSPLDGYEPRVLFGPRKDSKSLEMSSTPIPKRNSDPFSDDESLPRTPTKSSDPFTARLMKSVSTSQRATTPEIDSEEESTDHEDTTDQPQVITATTTTTTIHKRRFARPTSRTSVRDAPPAKKHFFR